MNVELIAVLWLLAVPLAGPAPAQAGATAVAGVIAQGSPAAEVAPAAVQGRPMVIEETDLDRQTRSLASQLRCVVCQGLSVEDSPSQLAQEMRALVREQLEAGMTPAEVKQFFVDKYGEWVLLEPDPTGFNLVVYVLPVVMLIGGAAFVFVTARRMVKPSGSDATGDIADHARDEAGVR